MKQGLFVIYDLKSKTTASQIMLAPDEDVIKRNLLTYHESLARSIQAFPEDFAVFSLGTYDDQTMKVEAAEDKDMCFSLKEIIDYVAVSKPA